jgi:hypothetical protein
MAAQMGLAPQLLATVLVGEEVAGSVLGTSPVVMVRRGIAWCNGSDKCLAHFLKARNSRLLELSLSTFLSGLRQFL